MYRSGFADYSTILFNHFAMAFSTANVTGYGTSGRNRLMFDGDATKSEHFKIKFLGHLRLQN